MKCFFFPGVKKNANLENTWPETVGKLPLKQNKTKKRKKTGVFKQVTVGNNPAGVLWIKPA